MPKITQKISKKITELRKQNKHYVMLWLDAKPS